MKWILICLAWISFTLGVIGAFLPILPTTPFLILSAFLFSKSSPRFHHWILSLPFAGQAITDWQTTRVINPRAKFICATSVVISLSLIWINANIPTLVKVGTTGLLIGVTFFVLSQKSSSDY